MKIVFEPRTDKVEFGRYRTLPKYLLEGRIRAFAEGKDIGIYQYGQYWISIDYEPLWVVVSRSKVRALGFLSKETHRKLRQGPITEAFNWAAKAPYKEPFVRSYRLCRITHGRESRLTPEARGKLRNIYGFAPWEPIETPITEMRSVMNENPAFENLGYTLAGGEYYLSPDPRDYCLYTLAMLEAKHGLNQKVRVLKEHTRIKKEMASIWFEERYIIAAPCETRESLLPIHNEYGHSVRAIDWGQDAVINRGTLDLLEEVHATVSHRVAKKVRGLWVIAKTKAHEPRIFVGNDPDLVEATYKMVSAGFDEIRF